MHYNTVKRKLSVFFKINIYMETEWHNVNGFERSLILSTIKFIYQSIKHVSL